VEETVIFGSILSAAGRALLTLVQKIFAACPEYHRAQMPTTLARGVVEER